MPGRYKGLILLFIILPLFANFSRAQSGQKTRILFLLDASGSMYAKMDGELRIDVAKRLLIQMVDSLHHTPNLEMALRVYGHRSPKSMRDCKDTKLEVPFSEGNSQDLIGVIRNIVPKGTTPIAYSLEQAAYDFPDKETRNIIILITDGIEECNGDPCAISLALQKKGIALRPFVIGLGLSMEVADAFDCVGKFYAAEDKESFRNILRVVVTHAINNTTAQVNLLDVNGKVTETNVNMTFSDAKTGQIIYNYYHTMNERGVPDTLDLDPSFRYNLKVHTIPPVQKLNIEINTGSHNIIPLDAPQGNLHLKVTGVTNYDRLPTVIRKAGGSEIINVQEINSPTKYIVGNYDLEVLTLPRITLKNVDIKQSHTTSINIPQPGKLMITSYKDMIGSIYTSDGRQLSLVCHLDETTRRQNITLQPGEYVVVYRARVSHRAFFTNEQRFKITSAGTTSVYLR